MSWLLLLLVLELQGLLVPAMPSEPTPAFDAQGPMTPSPDQSSQDDGVIGDQDY
jgi:hypothetical protein